MMILCAGPHVGGAPVLGDADTPQPPMLCEDCGLVYVVAQQLGVDLAALKLRAGQVPSVDVVCAVLLACRPAGYVPRYRPGQASWAADGSWPPPVPQQYAAALAKLPKYPRQGPQT